MIMKKVMFMAVAAAAISFASCTSNTNKGTASDADSVKTPVVETQEGDVTKDLSAKLDAKDAAGLQDALNSVNEKIKSLKEEGKLDEAKAMLKQVQDFLAANSEKVKEVAGNSEALNKIIEGVKAIPSEAVEAGNEATENVKEDVKTATDKAGKKAGETADKAKKEAKDKANKANKAIDKAAKGLGL